MGEVHSGAGATRQSARAQVALQLMPTRARCPKAGSTLTERSFVFLKILGSLEIVATTNKSFQARKQHDGTSPGNRK